MKHSSRPHALQILAFCLALTASPLFAATLHYDLDGGTAGFAGNTGAGAWDAVTSNWSTSAMGDVAPGTWTNGETASFTTEGALTVTLGAGFNPVVEGINYEDGSADGFLIEADGGGNTISLGAGGITNSNTTGNRTLTINPNIALTASQTWETVSNTGNSIIDVNGNVDVGTHDLDLIITNGEDIFIDGDVTGSGDIFAGNALANSNGSIRLGGDISAWTGNLTIEADTSSNGSNMQVAVVSDVNAATVSVTNQGRLQMNAAGTTISSTLILNGRGQFNTGALFANAANVTVTGQIQTADQTTIGAGANASLNIDGGITNTSTSNETLRLNPGTNATMTLNSVIDDEGAGTGNLIVRKESAGTLVMTTGNLHTYSGNTQILGGTLEVSVLANGGSPSHLGDGSTVEFGANFGSTAFGTLKITDNGSTDRNLTFIASDGGTGNQNGGAIEVTGSNVVTISGNVNRGGDANAQARFEKTGSGTLILSNAGNNNFDGQIYVKDGELQVNTVLDDVRTGLANGQETFVQIETGGTLSGTGEVTDVFLQSGGFIAPGASPGELTAADLTWDGGGAFNFELGATTTTADSDLLTLSGDLIKGSAGSFTFNFSDGNGAPVLDTYTLIDFASNVGFVVGDFDFTYTGSQPAFDGNFLLNPGSLQFQVTQVQVIPEPSAVLLLWGGTALLLFGRRRRS